MLRLLDLKHTVDISGKKKDLIIESKKAEACVKLHGWSSRVVKSSVAVILGTRRGCSVGRRRERCSRRPRRKHPINTGAVVKSQWCMSHVVGGDWAAGVGQEAKGGSL